MVFIIVLYYDRVSFIIKGSESKVASPCLEILIDINKTVLLTFILLMSLLTLSHFGCNLRSLSDVGNILL